MVNLGAADGDRWGCLGRNAVAKASHVAFRTRDYEVIAGVGLKFWDDCLFQTSVHLQLQMVILHLEGEGISER